MEMRQDMQLDMCVKNTQQDKFLFLPNYRPYLYRLSFDRGSHFKLHVSNPFIIL